jgi:hypothetical protein
MGTDWYQNSRDGQLHMVKTWNGVFATSGQTWRNDASGWFRAVYRLWYYQLPARRIYQGEPSFFGGGASGNGNSGFYAPGGIVYSKVWFNTPRLAAVQTT